MHSASNPHAFMGVTEQGLAAIVKTRGNKDVHVILRGGTKGPNFASEHVRKAVEIIEKKKGSGEDDHKPFASIMIDCSRKFFLVLIVFCFLIFSLSRRQFSKESQQPTPRYCQHLRATCGWREKYHWCHDRVPH